MPKFFCVPLFACNRQVDSLDKRQCNLQTIPSDIERYSRSLEELLLDMNHIRELPKSLFRLHKLQRLGLSDNDIHRIPPEIQNLYNLVELNLSRNDISDLPEDLKSCQHLLILDISSNPIARLPDSITSVVSLTHLSLNDTSLTKLPQDIGKLTGLRSLEVRENHLRTLPPSIIQLVKLQRLDVGQNELDDLPSEIGSLKSLQELYLDDNSIEVLPESILLCTSLEQLDLSSNRLMSLPMEFGDLINLADLTVSHNCLSILPNSIGRLKKLLILKADDNSLTQLTPAIGGCTSLLELYLMQNLISELPSSIGNLSNLQTLNLDKNQLAQIPVLIGDCSSLTVLSLRDNMIEELPMEVGKLDKLRVLDVCNNKLSYLPYTVNVLKNLQALWLSENQSQALLKLQTEQNPQNGVKVLTCYLLPQQSANSKISNNNNKGAANKSFVGGPKVHFGGETEEEVFGQSSNAGIGNFERHDTPHPKPHLNVTGKHKKQVIDGHIIPRLDETHPKTLALTRKVSNEHPSESTSNQGSHPRSALKYSSQNLQNQQQGPSTTSAATEIPKERGVVFAGVSKQGAVAGEDTSTTESGHKLKRINTPHYKSLRGGGMAVQQSHRTSATASAASSASSFQATQAPNSEGMLQREAEGSSSMNLPQSPELCQNIAVPSLRHQIQSTSSSQTQLDRELKRVIVRRDANGGLGLSIAGGLESTPYMDDDPGLFISKLISGGSAEKAGLRVSDKILEINGQSMVGQRHELAVQCIQQRMDAVEFLVERRPKLQHRPTQDIHSKESSKEGSNDPSTSAEKSNLASSYAKLDETSRPLTPSPTTAFSSQRASSPLNTSATSLPISKVHLLAADIPFGDNTLDKAVEEVELLRDTRNALGLSIVGGIDQCSHPFGTTQNPGVFISKIATSSPADKSRRLRIGDRILRVNGLDISRAKHNDAVEALKASGRHLRLCVRHDPQPSGLREALIRRRSEGHPLGLSICGGINNPANPDDRSDEGIFVENVEKDSPADSCGQIFPGTRLLEVNDESLLGCTKEEAAQIFRRAPIVVQLLVCDGFKNNASILEPSNFTTDDNSAITQEPIISRSPLLASTSLNNPTSNSPNVPTTPSRSLTFTTTSGGRSDTSPATNFGRGYGNTSASSLALSSFSTSLPLATSSPVVATPLATAANNSVPLALSESSATNSSASPNTNKNATTSSGAGVTTFSCEPQIAQKHATTDDMNICKLPPPSVANPKINGHSQSNGPSTSFSASTSFSSRLQHFEQKQQNSTQNPHSSFQKSNSISEKPVKRPLLSSNDIAKLEEDQQLRQQNHVGADTAGSKLGSGGAAPFGISPISPEQSSSFEHLLNNSPLPAQPSVPSTIRTKKAENRFLQNSSSATAISATSDEIQKRSEWRQARMRSLEAESQRANQLMTDMQEISQKKIAISSFVNESEDNNIIKTTNHVTNGRDCNGHGLLTSVSHGPATDIKFVDDEK